MIPTVSSRNMNLQYLTNQIIRLGGVVNLTHTISIQEKNIIIAHYTKTFGFHKNDFSYDAITITLSELERLMKLVRMTHNVTHITPVDRGRSRGQL